MNWKQAAAYYRKAIAKRYNQLNWHLGLARALADMNQLDEAFRIARTCMKMWPDSKPARSLAEELNNRLTALH